MSSEQVLCEMSINFESIRLTLGGNGTLWLEQPDGEGMEVNKAHFEEWLQAYFRDNY